jgi:uncharacterized protein
MRLLYPLATLMLVACLSGCDGQSADHQAGAPNATAAATPEPEEIDWDTLIPRGWQPETLFSQYDASNLMDNDPRAKELLGKLKRLWAEAPVVPELDGKRVRLPGFIVPLETNGTLISEFLLVPYYGACIHVPPPPANQTVYVRMPPERAFQGKLFDTIWVTGTLKVTPTSSELAEAGYRIEATGIASYRARRSTRSGSPAPSR